MTVAPTKFRMNKFMHRAFLREIDRLLSRLGNLDINDPEQVAGFQRRWRFFTETLAAHHAAEDQYLWPIAEQSADAEEQVVLHAMAAEHTALEEASQSVEATVSVLMEREDTRGITAALSDLAGLLAGHCLHEEHAGVPIVAKYISQEDFDSFMATSRNRSNADLILAWVCDGAPPEIVSGTWSMLPAPMRVMVRPRANRKYRRFVTECGF